MRRSPELQCESGQPALGSSRPRLRTPASAGHPAHSSSGRDTQADKAIRLWVAATGRALGAPLTGHDGAVLSVAFCPHRISTESRWYQPVTTTPCGYGTLPAGNPSLATKYLAVRRIPRW